MWNLLSWLYTPMAPLGRRLEHQGVAPGPGGGTAPGLRSRGGSGLRPCLRYWLQVLGPRVGYWNQMELKKLYHVFSFDGKRLLCCKVYGSRVRFWQDRARAMLTPYDECCRQVAIEASNALSKNVQTTNILDIVYYEDHPSLPSCASIAAPRPQNI